MKLLIFILLFLSFTSFSQLTTNKYHLYGKYSYGTIDTAVYSNYSIAFEYIFHKNFGLNYNIDFFRRNDNINQFHAPMGLLVGPLFFIAMASNTTISTNTKIGTNLFIGLLAFALPDGISYHIPIKYHWDLSPYINLLGFDYVTNKNTNTRQFKYASSFGIKTTYWKSDNFTFTAFTETRNAFQMGWSIGGGLGVGYTFSPRKDEIIE
jgi:hypothetical protein